MSNSNVNNGGAGFLSLLLVLFIGLKLTGFIAWSWWFIMAPMWVPIFLVLIGLAIMWKMGLLG